jgi:membrane fusion protein (multidrug efflux system)
MSDRSQDQDTAEADQGHPAPKDSGPGRIQDSGDGRGESQGRGQQDQKPRRKRRLPLILFGVVVVIALIVGFLWWYAHRNDIDTDDAFTDGRAVTVAPRVSAQVVALDVTDNQFVHAGQRLLKLDPSDFIAARDADLARLQSVQAQAITAKANLAIINITAPARLAQAEAQLEEAKANQFKAQRNYNRFHAVNPAATTREDIDAATASERQAAAQVSQAEAAVRSASTVVENIQQAEAQIRELHGQASQAQADLTQAELNLARTDVRAPQAGWITQRNVEMGNYVAAGTTIFSIVTPDVWVTANFKENQLARMHPGDSVDISVDAYPQLHLKGHVDSVQLGSGSKFSAFPAENATGNFVKIVQRVPVKIDIDSGLDPNLPLPLGISVEPTVHVK